MMMRGARLAPGVIGRPVTCFLRRPKARMAAGDGVTHTLFPPRPGQNQMFRLRNGSDCCEPDN